MSRDFTYIDDLVSGIHLLIDAIPKEPAQNNVNFDSVDSKSDVAPFSVNIGNAKPEKLTDFIEAIERSLGVKAEKNFLPMQAGDVPQLGLIYLY